MEAENKKVCNKKELFINIAIAVVSVAVVGVAGRFLTDTKSDWYVGLNKPSEFLPAAVFPIMWSIIYLAFAVVIFILLHRKQMDAKAVALLAANGVLQLLWSLVYFRFKSVLAGVCVIVLVLAAAIWLILYLDKKGKIYKYLLLVYPLWLTLATIVNTALWTLN